MDQAGTDPTALLAGLHDIRLPVEAPGGALAVVASAVGIGLLLAVCLAPLVRLLTAPRSHVVAPGIDQRIAALDGLPEDCRVEGLLALAAEVMPEWLRTLEPGIYRRDGVPTAAALEAALRRTDP